MLHGLPCSVRFCQDLWKFCPRALGLGLLVAGHLACSTVRLNDGSGCQSKFDLHHPQREPLARR